MQKSASPFHSGVTLRAISSMATRLLLTDIAQLYHQEHGVNVQFQSVGGVDAARRVRAGEAFELVALASDAIDALIADGHVLADGRTDFVRSRVAVAVRTDAPHPEIHDEPALRNAVLAARSIGYSTGPSGTSLMALFARWGIADAIAARIVQAPPGVPVGQLVADGTAELGFQQLSELMNLPGVDVLATLPPACEIVTTFSAALCVTASDPAQARALLAFLRSPALDDLKRRHGMDAA
jgi:molybdate transport system substrate-binding protein